MGLREKQGCPGGSGAVRIGVWGSRVESATHRWPGRAQPFAMLSRHVSPADQWARVPACGGCCNDMTRVGEGGRGWELPTLSERLEQSPPSQLHSCPRGLRWKPTLAHAPGSLAQVQQP